MKKGVFLLTLFSVTMFCVGCVSKLDFLARQNISEYRQCLFVSSGESFVATFTCGKRECSYNYDGVSNKLVDFGVLSIKYTTKLNLDNMPQYLLFIDTMQYEGVFEFNPIDNTYVADICKNISSYADIYLRVYGGGVDEQMKMICVSNSWKINYKQAFDIAIGCFEPILKCQVQKNKVNGEFFVKIVGENLENIFDICWYVGYVGQDDTVLACIINVNTGEIVAHKSQTK